ncbi:MAG: pilus assembly protein PilM [Ruminococcus sp.]|nr:pilus assembly protein PilM [Ruminococcus sp.]
MSKKEVGAYVYISNNKIQVLTGMYAKNKIQVRQVYEEELEEGSILNGIIMNNYALQETLTEMWTKNNLPTKPVHLIVNGSSITVKPLKIPQTPKKNIPGLIKSEFRDMEEIQNLLVDYSIVNPKMEDGSCSILAVLSTKDFINSYMELFQNAKIELESIDLMQNALIKITKRLKYTQNKTFTVFILDNNMLIQCLFANNNFIMTRRSRILTDPSDSEFVHEIGQNINSIIQFHKSEQTGTEITDFFFCGFSQEAYALFDEFARNFGVKVQAFPEYLPTEIILPEGQNPSNVIIPLGGMIRYSS